MTRQEYKKLEEEYKGKVYFVWSHWIDISMTYEEAKSFILNHIKEHESFVGTELIHIGSI